MPFGVKDQPRPVHHSKLGIEQDLELHTKNERQIRERTHWVRVCTVAHPNAANADWECVVGFGVCAPLG